MKIFRVGPCCRLTYKYRQKVDEAVFWNIDLLKVCSIRYMQPAHYSYVFQHEKVIFVLIFEIPSTIYLLDGIFMPKFPEIGQNFNKNPIS